MKYYGLNFILPLIFQLHADVFLTDGASLFLKSKLLHINQKCICTYRQMFKCFKFYVFDVKV